MLALAVGMTAFAQQKVAYKKGDAFKTPVLTRVQDLQGKDNATVMDFTPAPAITRAATHNAAKGIDEWETMTTQYDLQSNSMIGNRIAVWEDGTAAVTATWSSDDANTSYATRGTGYNYYDGSEFGDQPEERVEPRKSGWPSIAPVGNGEVLTSHQTGVYMYKRDTKGEGEWNEIQHFLSSNYHGYGCGEWTWARVATTGDNNQYVHVVMADQFTDAASHNRSIVSYVRSTDGGMTFTEIDNPPLVDPEADYLLDISADDYMIATNGDKVAILFASMNYDLFYLYSEDNGETWTKHVIWNFRGDEHAWDWGRTDVSADAGDTIWCVDNSASIAIDNAGTVHVAFGLGRWAPAPASGWGYYTYWPFTDGIVYWNSNYTNEEGGHNIPDFGKWSGDADFPAHIAANGTNGINSTLYDERLWALAEADGFNNLNLIIPDEDHDGMLGYTNDIWGNNWGSYRTQGIATLPAISVDENGNLIIAYSVLSETRTGQLPDGAEFYLRSGIITARDSEGEWYYDAINLSESYEHANDEVYSVTANGNGHNGDFWMCYSADDEMGLVLDYSTGDNAQSTASDNIIWAVKVNPTDLEGFDHVGEVVNPMTSARVYPNPATSVLNVEVNASQSSDVNMSVFNIMGQKVAEKNGNISTGINTLSINTNELSSGVYFVTVKANGFDKTMKFVVK